MPVVETFGSVTVICTDKTGALTGNEMALKSVFVNNKLLAVTGSGYDPEGDFELGGIEIDILDHLGFRVRKSAVSLQ